MANWLLEYDDASFVFLIKLRVVWEMLIQSSVKSGRHLLHLLWEETQNVVIFTMGKLNHISWSKALAGNVED